MAVVQIIAMVKPFRAEAVDFLFAGLRDALKLKKRDALRLTRDQLLTCAPIFTTAWLFIEIDRALVPAARGDRYVGGSRQAGGVSQQQRGDVLCGWPLRDQEMEGQKPARQE